MKLTRWQELQIYWSLYRRDVVGSIIGLVFYILFCAAYAGAFWK